MCYNDKRVLSLIYPDKFGDIKADEEGEVLLSEIEILHIEKKKIDCEELLLKNKIMQFMGNAICLYGNSYQAKFDSKMSLRFKKLKTK